MASGRDMSSSVLGSSDVIHDFSCTPCFEDGKNMEAINFCVNCQTYFCESCVGMHNKLLKSHSVLHQAAMKAGSRTQSKTTAILPTGDCDDHPGNVIQMYCGDHDLVCCTVCIAVDHRACKGVDFIPKVAEGIMKGQEQVETKASLDAVYKDLQQLKAEKSKELSELKESQEDILNEIIQFKDRVLARIDELERKAVTEVCAKYKEISGQINSELNSLDECLKTTAEQKKTLDEIGGDNEVQLFVNVKQSQKVKRKGENLIEELKHTDPRTISFEFDNHFESIVKDIESFGAVSANHPYTASLIGEYTCKTNTCSSQGSIFDCCVLDNGHVLLTDYSNEKLKRLDSAYNLKDWCHIDRPFGVCQTGPNDVAVSSWDGKKICLVSIGSNMTLKGSFSVGEHCRGIVHHKGELFIACGIYRGGGNTVKVYDLSGRLLRNLQCNVVSIMHMSMKYDGSDIVLAESNKGLVKLNRQGEKTSECSDPCLKTVSGVCYSTSGDLFVCCKDSNNVVQFDKDGNMIKEILTETDGIKSPASVTFVDAPERLILTFWSSNTIKVYKLS
ncbi:uncharacterized protein LOC123533913 [Mercenaria mercenaria]|uniref:uncharacterized protein LOC123533913 n=1 Tax=Mercenaria mercenaria TaxID=6596 RepID=UPI00234F8A3E|nr:uncharacterized protein LOC123533913 [Mercenaria mercenaria]